MQSQIFLKIFIKSDSIIDTIYGSQLILPAMAHSSNIFAVLVFRSAFIIRVLFTLASRPRQVMRHVVSGYNFRDFSLQDIKHAGCFQNELQLKQSRHLLALQGTKVLPRRAEIELHKKRKKRNHQKSRIKKWMKGIVVTPHRVCMFSPWDLWMELVILFLATQDDSVECLLQKNKKCFP